MISRKFHIYFQVIVWIFTFSPLASAAQNPLWEYKCTKNSKSDLRLTVEKLLFSNQILLFVSFPCRCDISVCYKPDSSTDWRLRRSQTSAQIQPLNPTFCSLLCLPVFTFSGALPWTLWLGQFAVVCPEERWREAFLISERRLKDTRFGLRSGVIEATVFISPSTTAV